MLDNQYPMEKTQNIIYGHGIYASTHAHFSIRTYMWDFV